MTARITTRSTTVFEGALREAGFEVQRAQPGQGRGGAPHRSRRAGCFRRCGSTRRRPLAGLDALGWYHEKRDEARDIGLGPDHDWSSHGADAFGLMCVAYEEPNEFDDDEDTTDGSVHETRSAIPIRR